MNASCGVYFTHYSEKNIPLKPKKFYNISLKEKESGDFAAVIGFPGSTSRYVTSYELENIINIENQARIDARTIILDIIKSRMRASDTIMLKYTSRSHILSNYWKNAIEANKSMRKLSTVKEKEDFHFGEHFVNAFKRLENYWKEEKFCDVTLIAGVDEKKYVHGLLIMFNIL